MSNFDELRSKLIAISESNRNAFEEMLKSLDELEEEVETSRARRAQDESQEDENATHLQSIVEDETESPTTPEVECCDSGRCEQSSEYVVDTVQSLLQDIRQKRKALVQAKSKIIKQVNQTRRKNWRRGKKGINRESAVPLPIAQESREDDETPSTSRGRRTRNKQTDTMPAPRVAAARASRPRGRAEASQPARAEEAAETSEDSLIIVDDGRTEVICLITPPPSPEDRVSEGVPTETLSSGGGVGDSVESDEATFATSTTLDQTVDPVHVPVTPTAADSPNVISVSSDDGSLPSDGGSLPSDGDSLPSDGGSLPSDDGSLPSDGGSLPSDGDSLPSDGGSLPSDDGSLPSNDSDTEEIRTPPKTTPVVQPTMREAAAREAAAREAAAREAHVDQGKEAERREREPAREAAEAEQQRRAAGRTQQEATGADARWRRKEVIYFEDVLPPEA